MIRPIRHCYCYSKKGAKLSTGKPYNVYLQSIKSLIPQTIHGSQWQGKGSLTSNFPFVFGFNLALAIAANIQKLDKLKRNKKLSEL